MNFYSLLLFAVLSIALVASNDGATRGPPGKFARRHGLQEYGNDDDGVVIIGSVDKGIARVPLNYREPGY
ncbi:unnamed protein product [Caenorhabditis sp. 36 PRJEB53466]|nr:unnamed protein product [Caenorhabditis sp. 36 PRJEB53466]